MLRKLLIIGLFSLSLVLIAVPLTAQDNPTSSTTLNGSAQIVQADIQAMNGVIHVIDTVFIPPQEETATEEASMTEEAGATAEVEGLDEAVENLDEIGATSDALLAEISATNTAIFGEISGTSTALASEISGTATALQSEILGTPAATEDMVMTNEAAMTEEVGATEEADTSTMTVLEILASDPELSTAYAAIQAAGLTDALGGAGPFTLFVPNNAAFEAYFTDNSTSDEGLFQNTEYLTDLLLYHVVSGQYLSNDLAGQSSLMTLQGGSIDLGGEGEAISSTEEMAATDDTMMTEEAVTPEMTPES
jgi:transforming growth factor-beta-induced protein